MKVAVPPPMPGVPMTRQQMIEERQRRSIVWRTIHVLASLKLALLLLATIAIACAVATVCESTFNTAIAKAYIYKAPWFMVWLAVLCVNLFAVTLSRWPWQKKHAGFIITHYGIITLLIGAMVGMHCGYEGNVVLHTDEPPVARVTTSRSVIQVESPADMGLYVMPFDAAAVRPSARRPRTFAVPGTDLRIVADDFNENLGRTRLLQPSDSPQAGPGVSLHLASGMSGGQQLDVTLRLDHGQADDFDMFGIAQIRLQPKLDPARSPDARETQVVFANFAPVIQSAGTPSGVSVRLSSDGSTVTVSGPDGSTTDYAREDILKRMIPVGPVLLSVTGYWPDFTMENGRPVTKSPLPNNPAILVKLYAMSADKTPALTMAPAPNGGGIDYQLSRGGVVYGSGTAKTGDVISLGWSNWRAEVKQYYPHSSESVDVEPATAATMQGIAGFRARLKSEDGSLGAPVWIAPGQLATLVNGGNVVHVAYGLEVQQLPFTIGLKKFEVPRYEGTTTPSNFISTVEFQDLQTGHTKEAVARMNHPASFPGTFLANLTGINYKFSQAEWNPRDLGQTTLQVLYDPGWMLKWIGSLAIVAGIATMFYIKPR
jgi:hypothetical protein